MARHRKEAVVTPVDPLQEEDPGCPFSEGDKVRHPFLGMGEVVALRPWEELRMVRVRFNPTQMKRYGIGSDTMLCFESNLQ